VPTLLTVGNRLKDIDVSKVAFVAAPTEPAVSDSNRLQLAEPAASQLFAALRKDVDLTDPTATPSATPAASASGSTSADATATPTAAAPAYNKALQPVAVANGSSDPAKAKEVLAAITAAGFSQSSQFTARAVPTTAVYYGSNYADVAADIATLLGIPASQVLPAAGVTGVQVYLGSDYTAGAKQPEAPASLPPDIVNQTAGDTVCQQANPAMITR
jgi:hypothetical protein